MWSKLRQRIKKGKIVLAIAPSVAGVVIAVSFTGLFQLLEWATLDLFFRSRPTEPIDPRIVVVTIGEADISKLGQWPISDELLAQVITNLKLHQPRAIGLDIYRNLPVEPGHQNLLEVFKSTPNLIGIEKAVSDAVAAPQILAEQGQIGISDMVLDPDSKVRRGLISVKVEDGQVKLGIATKLALMYLEQEGINPELVDSETQQIKIGQTVFSPFNSNDGGYVNADTGGYQILLNYRGAKDRFKTVTVKQVLENKLPADLVRDRIVIIGSVAQSLNDCFYTPYNHNGCTSGVFIHANLTSKLVSAALGERQLIQVLPEPLEWLWILVWSGVGVTIGCKFLQIKLFDRNISAYFKVVVTGFAGVSLITISYFIFLGGWWLPVVSPLLALTASATVTLVYYNQKLQHLAYYDGLTLVANRRYFDQYLERKRGEEKSLSLILCDVDYFKLYNDTYGHQAGDRCLQQVAEAIRKAIRRFDLVARYGGEEFAIVLPNTEAQDALQIAQRIQQQVRSSQIPHKSSKVSQFVTLSCGVASFPNYSQTSAAEAIASADQALYRAKEAGRDRVVLEHHSANS